MLTGVILAGGRNSRMNGQNKALLIYQGEAFIVRQVREMRPLCSPIMIVTNDPSPYRRILPPDIRYIPDIYAGHGPLSGFHAAFAAAKAEYAWVTGCDSPDISAAATSWMLTKLQSGGYDAVLPVIGGRHQMLHGVYRPQRLLPEITARLETGQYRLSGLLDSLHWFGADEEELAAAGINNHFSADIDTPEQYKELLQQLPEGCDGIT